SEIQPVPGPPGFVVVNPPYGERLGEAQHLRHLYSQLGEILRERFAGYSAHVLTGNETLGRSLGLSASKRWKVYNGPIECLYLSLHIDERAQRPTPEAVTMVINRLRKNLKRLAKWQKREEVSCYRLYDADIPEYA